MSGMPENVKKEWENRVGAVVFTTVDAHGTPNSIYATCVGLYEDKEIVIANNYFNKTMSNIKDGSMGSVLFITEEKKAYQIKGGIEYFEDGPVFEFMKSWNPEKHPGHGAAAVRIESVWSGAEKLA